MFHTLYDLGTNGCVRVKEASLFSPLCSFLSVLGLRGLWLYRRFCHELVMTPKERQSPYFYLNIEVAI